MKIETLEHPWCNNDCGCGGASFNDVIDKINEVIDVLNGEQKEQKPVEQITDAEMKESMDAVRDFKVFVVGLARDFNITITHERDIDWHNFCAGLLTYLERNKPVELTEEDSVKPKFKPGMANVLKSLRPQKKENLPKWKPSEEQMQILRAVIDFATGKQSVFYTCHQPLLESLYNDLKKLKED